MTETPGTQDAERATARAAIDAVLDEELDHYADALARLGDLSR